MLVLHNIILLHGKYEESSDIKKNYIFISNMESVCDINVTTQICVSGFSVAYGSIIII